MQARMSHTKNTEITSFLSCINPDNFLWTITIIFRHMTWWPMSSNTKETLLEDMNQKSSKYVPYVHNISHECRKILVENMDKKTRIWWTEHIIWWFLVLLFWHYFLLMKLQSHWLLEQMYVKSLLQVQWQPLNVSHCEISASFMSQGLYSIQSVCDILLGLN